MPVLSAQQLLKQYWNGQLPVDPIDIAHKSGVRVIKTSCEIRNESGHSLSGQYRNEDGPIIYFYGGEAPVRQRFTVAHELGHHMLGHGPSHRDNDQNFSINNYNIYEVEANNFAAELLMPAEAVRYMINSGVSTLEGLAEVFNVSTVAMQIRLKKLGII